MQQYVVTPYVVSSTASSVATQPSSVDYVNSLPAMQGMPAAVAPPSDAQAIRSSYGAAQLRKYNLRVIRMHCIPHYEHCV